MKTKILIVAALVMVFAVLGSGQTVTDGETLAVDGSVVRMGKDWKLLRAFFEPGEGKRVTALYSYQISTVAKSAPNTYKFWMKVKDYEKNDLDARLFLYEVRCNANEIRVVNTADRQKDGTSDTFPTPNAAFAPVKPRSLNELAFKGVCSDYNKPN
jgi:hypothetical protein